jgi:hypothetical protein
MSVKIKNIWLFSQKLLASLLLDNIRIGLEIIRRCDILNLGNNFDKRLVSINIIDCITLDVNVESCGTVVWALIVGVNILGILMIHCCIAWLLGYVVIIRSIRLSIFRMYLNFLELFYLRGAIF